MVTNHDWHSRISWCWVNTTLLLSGYSAYLLPSLIYYSMCALSTTAELAENGSIYDYLHQKEENPSLEQSLLWAKQIAEGTVYVYCGHNKVCTCFPKCLCAYMNTGRLPQVSPLPSLLVGMNYLHQKDIIHRDLKSTNSAFCRLGILKSESIIRDLAESNTPTHTCTAGVK